MATERTVMIGSADFRAECPVPRVGIGFWEGFALSMRGRLDARRNRVVLDSSHTHSLHRLLARHRQREIRAGLSIDAALSGVAHALAPLEIALTAATLAVPDFPTSQELASLPDDARAEWARRMREARMAHADHAASEGRRLMAEVRVAELRSIRAGLLAESEDVRRLWREAYLMRAARYTRARFGRGGAPMVESPGVAGYIPAEPPSSER